MDKSEKGKQASIEGFANEHIAIGILMREFQNVSLVDLPLSSYDIIIAIKLQNSKEEIIRAQVKTAKKSISFIGGVRGGVDRVYKSDVKEYIQSTETSDLIIGVTPIKDDACDNRYSLYFFPTMLVEMLKQKSISINKIKEFKNNFEIVRKCKDREYINSLYNIIVSHSAIR